MQLYKQHACISVADVTAWHSYCCCGLHIVIRWTFILLAIDEFITNLRTEFADSWSHRFTTFLIIPGSAG